MHSSIERHFYLSKIMLEGKPMPDTKQKRVITEAQKKAQKKYMEGFCEVKVRMTKERREEVQEFAKSLGKSTTQFINDAIDEAMKR